MGLAARKEKQRIGADPRNLTWSEDKSRFGQQYLAKFGWTPESGAGLGANGDGRLKHISVVQKLNLLGVGNGQGSLNNPDAIAYKQNNDFEKMLKRLNQSGGSDSNDEARMQEEKDEKLARIVMQGFVPADKTDAEHAGVQPQEEDIEMAEVDKKSEKERRREEKRRKKLLKQQQKGQEESSSSVPQPQSESDSTMTPPVVTIPDATSSKPRMAHRAKFRASKQLASLSSAALSEILGVASSASNSAAPSHMATPPIMLPETKSPENEPASNPPETRNKFLIEEQLTISSTSMADYFAAKLKARKAQMAAATSSAPANDGTLIEENLVVQVEDKEEESIRRSEKREKKKEKKRKREAKEMEVDETNIQDLPERDTAMTSLQEEAKAEGSHDEEPLKKKKKKRKQGA